MYCDWREPSKAATEEKCRLRGRALKVVWVRLVRHSYALEVLDGAWFVP